jgi:lipopolysaccharide export system protein LptA
MLKRCFRNSLLILVSLLFLAAVPRAGDQAKGKREPIVITASRMEADKLGDKITFKGDVTLKKEGMTLYSDRMIVFYDEPSKGINVIEALGNVVVRKEGRVALSKKASYYSKEEKIVLTGDARIIENENQLGGERITLFMREDRSVVEGGKVLFYQDNQRPEGRKRK